MADKKVIKMTAWNERLDAEILRSEAIAEIRAAEEAALLDLIEAHRVMKANAPALFERFVAAINSIALEVH